LIHNKASCRCHKEIRSSRSSLSRICPFSNGSPSPQKKSSPVIRIADARVGKLAGSKARVQGTETASIVNKNMKTTKFIFWFIITEAFFPYFPHVKPRQTNKIIPKSSASFSLQRLKLQGVNAAPTDLITFNIFHGEIRWGFRNYFRIFFC